MSMLSEQYGIKANKEEKNISDVRIIYRTRFGQKPFAGNFSTDNQHKKYYLMRYCGIAKEKEKHVTLIIVQYTLT